MIEYKESLIPELYIKVVSNFGSCYYEGNKSQNL